jgi:hypothetical protein
MVSFQPKIGSWLALAALALQLALSFTHVHVPRVYGLLHGEPVTGASATIDKLPTPEPADSATDYCVICASIQLAASSLLPKPQQLPTSFVNLVIEHVSHVALAISVPRRILFQPRGPPPD